MDPDSPITPIQETTSNEEGTPVYLSPSLQAGGCRSLEHRPRAPLMRLDGNISRGNTGTEGTGKATKPEKAERAVREKAAREQVIKECIISCKVEFGRYMSKFEIVGKMKQQGLLTEREELDLMSKDQVDINSLVKMLECKSDDAFTRFYNALKAEKSHLGHEQLAKLIEDVL